MLKPTLFRLTRLFFVLVAWGTTADAQTDRVRTIDGSVVGTVTETSREGITIRTDEGVQQIGLPEVRSILFDDEPAVLSQARINAANGGYPTALEKLDGLALDDGTNRFVREEFAFLRAECAARLAIGGQSDPRAAGRALVTFLKQHPKSHFYYPAVTTMGDLLQAIDRPDRAEQQYALLAEAPWPDYQARSNRLVGLTYQQRNDHAAAIRRFDEAIRTSGKSPKLNAERNAARLTKAESLAATGRLDEALRLVRDTIRGAGESFPLRAAGYNALGRCYLKVQQPTDAMLAFLRVDYFFQDEAESHAEALHHLATLWSERGKPEEAQAAQATLHRRYATSRWAQK